MPLGRGVRYRWKTTKSGKKIRLAFRGNKVIEVKKKGGEAKKVNPHPPKRTDKEIREMVARARTSR